VSSEGLARGAGELSCAELDSTFSSPPSGSGFSIFGAAGGADVPSFLSGRRITASSRCAVFARLFWSAEGPSFALVAGAGAGGGTTEDAGRRRGSRRVVSQTGSSEALGSDAEAARPNSSERSDSGSVRPGRSRGGAARGD
jgi:hypothetical protein